MHHTLLATTLLTLFAAPALAATCAPHQKPITPEEVAAAQQAWASGIVAIGQAKDPKKAALEHLNTLYAYDMGKVLFKPTKAAVVQFRDSKEEALSYFVGGKEPEDKGFALAPFTKVRFENHTVAMDCDSALAQGNYYFTPSSGEDIKVEYSFGYVRDANGRLKINLHHSSLPYKPQ